jgi:outer membrane lipoprotein-sorting protein
MKSFTRLSLAAIAVIVFFNAFAVSETKAQFAQQEILNRMDRHNKALQSLRSNVKMVKYNNQLKETDVTEGATTYLPSKGREAYVRIDWTKPAEEMLVVRNGQYMLYRKRLNQVITGKVKDAQGSGKANNALAFMNMSKAQLKANYSIKYLGEETVSNGVKTARLELVPKQATSYKLAEIWVDADGMPIQAKVVENNNDTTTVMLSNLQKNISINANVFDPKLPKDVRKVAG